MVVVSVMVFAGKNGHRPRCDHVTGIRPFDQKLGLETRLRALC